MFVTRIISFHCFLAAEDLLAAAVVYHCYVPPTLLVGVGETTLPSLQPTRPCQPRDSFVPPTNHISSPQTRDPLHQSPTPSASALLGCTHQRQGIVINAPGFASPPPWTRRALVRGRHPPWLKTNRPVLALPAENALKACPHDASAVFSTRASACSRLRRAARQYRRACEG